MQIGSQTIPCGKFTFHTNHHAYIMTDDDKRVGLEWKDDFGYESEASLTKLTEERQRRATVPTTRGFVIGRLFWDDGHPSPWMSFVNQTAFERWRRDVRIARPGAKTEWHYCDSIWTAEPMLANVQRDARESTMDREALIRRRDEIEEQLSRLDALPAEPVMDDPASVIWFVKKFGDQWREYTYAAVRVDDGLWYTTGPRSPKGCTWDDLVTWMLDDGPDMEVWVAVEWERL